MDDRVGKSDTKCRAGNVQQGLTQRPNMTKLVKTDNACNKADQKQDDTPLGNNQGCHSGMHWYTFETVLNCRSRLSERPSVL